MISLVIIAVIAALSLAIFNFFAVNRRSPGDEKMKEIATAIREGANAFLNHEYRLISVISIVVSILLAILVSIYSAIAFILGATMSAVAGLIGMKIATVSNTRVVNRACETGSLGDTLKVAFQGGSVMGTFLWEGFPCLVLLLFI